MCAHASAELGGGERARWPSCVSRVTQSTAEAQGTPGRAAEAGAWAAPAQGSRATLLLRGCVSAGPCRRSGIYTGACGGGEVIQKGGAGQKGTVRGVLVVPLGGRRGLPVERDVGCMEAGEVGMDGT